MRKITQRPGSHQPATNNTLLLPSAASRRQFAPLRAVSCEICVAFNLCRITSMPTLSLNPGGSERFGVAIKAGRLIEP